MAFWLTVAYVILIFLSPEDLIPNLAPYRPMLWLAGLALLASAGKIVQNSTALFRMKQTYLLLGLISAVVMSEIVHLWFGGALAAFTQIMPTAIVFFLVAINVNNWQRIRILSFAIVGCGLVLLARGIPAYYSAGRDDSVFVFHSNIFANGDIVGVLYRLRGVGYLNDPNDFAQFLLTTLPLVWLMWKPKHSSRNFFLMLLPSTFILSGIFLTHSRGGLIGIVILLLLALRTRLGAAGSAIVSAIGFLAAMGLQFTGNRGISESDGADRIEAWSAGLGMFRSSPFFGIGFDQFHNFYEITAHNSFVLCFAELGIFGFFCWLGLLLITILQLNEFAYLTPSTAAADQSPTDYEERSGFARSYDSTADSELEQPSLTTVDALRRWSNAIKLSVIVFMVTSWFLSRTYVVTIYLYTGMAVALTGIADREGFKVPPIQRNWCIVTMGSMFALILSVYIIVHLHWVGF